ncbi:MAG: AMP-binding protein [Geodermatophilaceae bacterium]
MPARPLHAVLLPPGPALLPILAAALDGGPAILPLDPAAPAEVLRRQLAALAPDAVVDADGLHKLDADAGQPGDAAAEEAEAEGEDDVAVVVATSGSTGPPKGVELTAAALRQSAAATLQQLGADRGQRWLCCLPTSNIAGLQVLVRSLLAGSSPEFGRFDPASLAASSADFVSVVPTMLLRALDAGSDLRRFEAVLVGGAAADPALVARARAAGVRVVTTYGMTETAGGCVYDGVPLPDVQVTVDDQARIWLAGAVLARGYRRAPARSAAAFIDGWYRTEDRGRLEPDGRLTVLGRLDDIVVSGGVNVSLPVVAAALAGHPDVADATAFARPDAEWGQRIVAVVVPGDRRPDLAELRSFVAATAGAAAAPRDLVLVAALPLLPGGKLDRQALAGLNPSPAEPAP